MAPRLAVLLFAAIPLAAGAREPVAQTPQPVMPHVIAADVPTYPRSAASAGKSALLTIGVRTDGHRVSDARLLSSAGETVLREAAVKNVRTWRFTPHAPATFDVTFRFTIVDRPCDRLGRDTHDAAVIHFPASVEVFAERDPDCPGATRPPPIFGIYVISALVPVFPPAALANGVDGDVTISMTYKNVLSVVDAPAALGEPIMDVIRERWQYNAAPYLEELRFKFRLEDGECKGGPDVVVGAGLTSYEIKDRRACAQTLASAASPLPVIARAR